MAAAATKKKSTPKRAATDAKQPSESKKMTNTLSTAEEKPNYTYGLGWEKYVGNYFKERFGGYYDLSPGSRGAADCINYAPSVIICTQVKASRAASQGRPNASVREQEALRLRARNLAHARQIPAVAMLALVKGTALSFRQLDLYKPQLKAAPKEN